MSSQTLFRSGTWRNLANTPLCSSAEAALAITLKAQSQQGPSLQQQALHADEAAEGAVGQAAYTPFLLLGGDSEKGMTTNKRNPSPSSPDPCPLSELLISILQ